MSSLLKTALVIAMWFGQRGPVYTSDKAKARIEACPGSIHTRHIVKGTALGTTCQLYKAKQNEKQGVDA
jgi:hypothetical protein